MTEGIKSLAVEKPPSGVCAYRHIHLNGLHCDILSSYVELNERALSLSRNGTGWSVAIIWGDARRAYKRTLYFMFSNKDFLLHKIKKEDISFEKDSSKSYCKKMNKPISMKKIVLDDCLD